MTDSRLTERGRRRDVGAAGISNGIHPLYAEPQ
jgi:hypothetical protein